jgi:hypothetical protein
VSVPEATVTGGGWTPCFTDKYADDCVIDADQAGNANYVAGHAQQTVYYDAAVAPHRPVQRDKVFLPAGHHRWALGVSMTPGIGAGSRWNLGVRIGEKMVVVHVRVGA